ncbi:MAG: heavy metal-associated domain-containing protein [Bacteroidales bacterium]|nr:heavy metal-associated domain-containing protein [Bacteroidales bacterium]
MELDFRHFLFALVRILNEMSPYILLGFLLAGVLHVFVRPAQMSRHLSGKGWKPVVKAALLGIPLPLCSCGVLPTAISLRRQGASRGASTSFLIATPQTGVDSIAATYALLGLPFAILRPVAALAGSVFGGMAVDRFDTSEADGEQVYTVADDKMPGSFIGKIAESLRYGLVDMVGSVGKWLIIGLLVATVITVAVPDSLFLSLSEHPVLAMLVMVAVAVPMYICATGSIPIAMSLMLKGLTPGVAFVLLMAGPAANFASVILLRKNLGKRATTIYVGAVVVTALLFGIIIDYLLPASWFALPGGSMTHGEACHLELPLFSTACTALLLIMLGYSFYRNNSPKSHSHGSCACSTSDGNNSYNSTSIIMENQKTYNVKGMACAHCKATVEKAVAALPGVTSAVADLAKGTVEVTGPADPEAVRSAIVAVGFDA